MSLTQISALVPIKNESERLPHKNFKSFAGNPLYFKVLDTLASIDAVDRIIINTDSEEIFDTCVKRYEKAVLIQRPDFLLGNHITMNSLITYDLTQIEGEHFLQTHVTNPLLSKKTVLDAIERYFNQLESYDSLFTVNEIKKRAYNYQQEPINHELGELKMTQDLPPVLVENSNLFLFSRTSFNATKSRIGERPAFMSMNEFEAVDIDTPVEFKLAELIHANRSSFGLED